VPCAAHFSYGRGQLLYARECGGHLLLFQQKLQLDFGQEESPHK
jgi:hypothetical protein